MEKYTELQHGLLCFIVLLFVLGLYHSKAADGKWPNRRRREVDKAVQRRYGQKAGANRGTEDNVSRSCLPFISLIEGCWGELFQQYFFSFHVVLFKPNPSNHHPPQKMVVIGHELTSKWTVSSSKNSFIVNYHHKCFAWHFRLSYSLFICVYYAL